MATLTVNVTTDFSGQVLNNIDVIDFTNGSATTAIATFDGAQFGPQISGSVLIDGSGGTNGIVVDLAGGGFNALGWTFNKWSAADTIVFNGSTGSDNVLGTSQNDRINGGGGGDLINGGGGIDVLNGGAGNDQFFYTSGGGLAGASVNGGDDFDIVTIGDGTYNFAQTGVSNIEELFFLNSVASSATLTGDQIGAASGLTFVTGNGSADTLNVKGSAIDLSGVGFFGWTDGQDTIALRAGNGDAAITGSSRDDSITGKGGDDNLEGGAGADTLAGGKGQDQLTGGGNADTFSFKSAAEAGNGTSRDVISDFVQATDLIKLSGIDAIAGGGDNAFDFIGNDAFGNTAGELRFQKTATQTIVSGDSDGDGTADFQVGLTGLFNLTAADFVL